MRPHDWPQRLLACVRSSQTAVWEWGKHDCCTFARDGVLAVGGPDLGAGWEGSYADEAGAGAAVHSLGRNLEAAMEVVCQRAELPEISTTVAQRGDLVVLLDQQMTANLPLPGICQGDMAVARTRRGVKLLPMSKAVRAWAVR